MARHKDDEGHEDDHESSRGKHRTRSRQRRAKDDRHKVKNAGNLTSKKVGKIQGWLDGQESYLHGRKKYVDETIAGSYKWSSRQSNARRKDQKKETPPKITLSQRGCMNSEIGSRKTKHRQTTRPPIAEESDEELQESIDFRKVRPKKKKKSKKLKAESRPLTPKRREANVHKPRDSSGSGGRTVKVTYSRSESSKSSDGYSSEEEERSTSPAKIGRWVLRLLELYAISREVKSKDREREKRRRKTRHVSRQSQAKRK